MIYELRIYECVPGKLPDLNKRFATITLNLWEKHGIKQAGFWTTVIGESSQTLYYMLAWESLADREEIGYVRRRSGLARWAKTEENGPIVANVKNTHSHSSIFFSEITQTAPACSSPADSRDDGAVVRDCAKGKTHATADSTGDVNLMNVTDPATPFRHITANSALPTWCFPILSAVFTRHLKPIHSTMKPMLTCDYRSRVAWRQSVSVGITNNVNYGEAAILHSIAALDQLPA